MGDGTGRLVTERDGTSTIEIERRLPVPVREVWSSLTESDRLGAWIGTYTGDPTSGLVSFRMTAEGEDVPASDWVIHTCEPPSTLLVSTAMEDQQWRLELRLVDLGDATQVRLRQPGIDAAAAASVGPGWEYYLDRLAAVLAGGDPAAVDFERDYYPALATRYGATPA